VVGVPDPLFSEVGHAYLVLQPGVAATEAELALWCRERLADFKVPKRILMRSALPLVAVGKIDKAALRREAVAAQSEGAIA